MTTPRLLTFMLTLATLAILGGCSDPDDVPASHISAVDPTVVTGSQPIETFANKTALYGDLHVHTSWSADAYAGGLRLGPNDAYRFARGEAVALRNGASTQLKVPLDFVAITDHAENFTTHLACTTPGLPEFETDQCRQVRSGMDQESMLKIAFERGIARPALRDPVLCADESRCLDLAKSTWQRIQDTANSFNDPGRFTTLIGYEFSSLLSDFGMLHRNVIFRGTDVIPHAISSQDVKNQRELFARLEADCRAPCEVLTIPHNTNYSWGLTFSRTDEDGEDYTLVDLERRAKIDRLFEITQQKGNSECQFGVGLSDEDCNFGKIFPACEEGQETKCDKPASMYRDVMADGLRQEDTTGVNPNKMGIIGSTDTHESDPGNTRPDYPTRFASAAEWGFMTDRLLEMEHIVAGPIRNFNLGGLAGVWAESNTREDIFDALHRRETFGTTGSRLKIRFFAGDFPEGFPQDITEGDDPMAFAYAMGVPMGGDLPTSKPPTFWVWAAQDPNETSLDRVQMIKVWLQNGEAKQRVWDVACSGGRTPGPDGRCPKTSASVDTTTCEVNDTAGAADLQASFRDPDFNPEQSALYYVKVFENPVCRWTTRLANDAGTEPPQDLDAAVQHRGWSSPIWVN